MNNTSTAYQIGCIHAKVKMIKDDLVMGLHSDAMKKASELDKFITEITHTYYTPDTNVITTEAEVGNEKKPT